MAQQTMYPAMPNSPQTELTAAVTSEATTIPVANASALPGGPNLATIGTEETAEVVLYTAVSGNSLTGVTRGTSGTIARSWSQGAKVSRCFTSYDHDIFKNNIEDIDARTGGLASDLAQSVDELQQADDFIEAKTDNLRVDFDETGVKHTTADITYYVRTDGNDANTGLADTADGAFKTIGKAVSMIPQIVNHTASVNVAAGTYAEDVIILGTNGAGYVAFNGTSATIRSFTAGRCSRVVVSGFTATATTQAPFYAYDGGKCDFNNCITTVSGSPASGVAIFNQNSTIKECTISNRGTAIQVEKGQVTIMDCTGTDNATAILPAGGAVVNTAGTLPSGAINGSYGGVLNPWGDNTALSRPAARAYSAAVQSLTASVMTKVLFGTETFDNTNAFANSAFAPGQAGIYQINALATFINVPTTASAEMFLYVNGQYTRRLGLSINSGTGSATHALSGSATIALVAGDFVEIYVKTSASVTLSDSTDTIFETVRLA